MRIGVFDSGLGGLVIHQSIVKAMPEYDTVYLGDTLHVPYGGRSAEAIMAYSQACVDYLFREQDCQIVIVACNTASTTALRPIQQNYLVNSFPDRRVLGVVIPTIETCVESGHTKIGLLATQHSVRSNVYEQEIQKLNPAAHVVAQASPLLVPMIEHNGIQWVRPILQSYLEPLLEQGIQSLILGCTHYPVLKDEIRSMLPVGVSLVSQDEIIPDKLADYLSRHPEQDKKLGRTGQRRYLVTDYSENYEQTAQILTDGAVGLFEKVVIT